MKAEPHVDRTSPKPLRPGLALHSILAAGMLLASVAGAATYRVAPGVAAEGDGQSWSSPVSLTNAVALAANADDVLLLKAGTYELAKQIAISTPIVVKGGLAGTDDTTLAADPVSILDGGNNSAFYSICAVSAATSGKTNRFERISFRNGFARAVYKSGAADLWFENCSMVTNGTTGHTSSQADSYGKCLKTGTATGSTITFRNCDLRGNRSTCSACYSGGALYVTSGKRLVLENCVLAFNGCALRGQGGGSGSNYQTYWFDGSAIYASVPVTATGCTIAANRTERCHSSGGCVHLTSGAQGSAFTNCVWMGNQEINSFGTGFTLDVGGALYVNLGAKARTVDLESCTFAYNIVDGKTCAALTLNNGTLTAHNCVFGGNIVSSWASQKATDLNVRDNGILNLSYSLLSGSGKEAIEVSAAGTLNTLAGVSYGDALFVTTAAEAATHVASGDVSYWKAEAASYAFLEGMDAHLRSAGGTTLNDGTVQDFTGELSPGVDGGDPDSPYALEPTPNGNCRNLGAYGGTAAAAKTPASAPGFDGDIEVLFLSGISQPSVAFTLGGSGMYTVAAIVSVTTNGTDWVYTSPRIEGLQRGSAVTNAIPRIFKAGDYVTARVTLTNLACEVSATSAPTEVVGEIPIWYGHGGDPDKVVHLRSGAFGAGDGTSWGDAVPTLPVALTLLTETRNELWIAGDVLLTLTPATLTTAFGYTIRGGFDGHEDTLAQRASGTHSTLDGDNQYKMLPLANGGAVRVERIRFVKAITRAFEKTGAGDLTVDDCLFLTNGTAAISGAGKGLCVSSASGARITVTNCVFRGNRALSSAGDHNTALYVAGCAGLSLADTLFVANGTLLNNGGGGSSGSHELENNNGAAMRADVPVSATFCRFIQNNGPMLYADGGSAVYLGGAASGSAFTNCIWACNTSRFTWGMGYGPYDSGGALCVNLSSAAGTVDLKSCTFAYNIADAQKCAAGLTVKSGTVTVGDSIFFGNRLGPRTTDTGADINVLDGSSCTVAYSLLANDAYSVTAHGTVTATEGIVSGDPLFVTTAADITSRINVGSDYTQFKLDAATVAFIEDPDVHLRSKAGYRTNASAAWIEGEEELSPAIDKGGPDSDYANEPEPNGERINLGAYGNTDEASRSSVGQVGFDGDIVVSFPTAEPRPRVSLTVGGTGDFSAELVIRISTNGTDWCWTADRISALSRGDSVVLDLPFCLVPTGTVIARAEISGKGDPVTKDSAATPITGTLPIWFGHGGDSNMVMHVRAGAYGKGDGSSWCDAVTNLTEAFRMLKATHGEIWIAGTLSSSIKTLSPSVAYAVRGGFDGHEDAPTDRTAGAYSTLDGADTYNLLALGGSQAGTVERLRFVRAKSYALQKSGSGALTVTDCFFATNGNHSAGSHGSAGGKGLYVSGGGVITVKNCTFYENRSTATDGMAGGAIQASGCTRLVVTDCDFIGNGVRPAGPGGGNGSDHESYWFSGSVILSSVPVVATRCRFVRNVSCLTYSTGGCLVLESGAGGSAFTNCLWAGNLDKWTFSNGPRDSAGALVVNVGAGKNVTVSRCTFAYNLSDQCAAGAGITLRSGSATVRDSIFHGNMGGKGTAGKGRDLYLNANTSVDVAYTCFDAADPADLFTCPSTATTNFGAGVIFADPQLATALADLSSFVSQSGTGAYFANTAAAVSAFGGIDAHLRGKQGYLDERLGREVYWPGFRSPAIGAADPASGYSREPRPNANRANLGCYGNTPYATRSGGGVRLLAR